MALFGWVREANRRDPAPGGSDLREMLSVVGLENLLDRVAPGAPPEVLSLADRRQEARARGDFEAADTLRDEIATRGWQVRDVANGYELLPR
jgi:cysteinyl-tRNA synthetase